MIGHGAILQLHIDQRMCLCPQGTAQEVMQTGVQLDTTIDLYVNRLAHSGALTNLTRLISDGGVALAELFSLNAIGGAVVAGDISFDSRSHTLTFTPRAPLQTSTLYTVTLKGEPMQVKKEVSELCGNVGKSLVDLLDHPDYTCTFTTASSPRRRLTLYCHFENQPLPTADALRRLPRAAATLRNDEEVLEGLRVSCAIAFGDIYGDVNAGVNEDEDILSIRLARATQDGSSLQFQTINHSNMASIADNETLLVTLRAPTDEENEAHPARRQRVDSGEPAQPAVGVAVDEARGAADTARPSARERMAAAQELLRLGMMSPEEFEAKRLEIIRGI